MRMSGKHQNSCWGRQIRPSRVHTTIQRICVAQAIGDKSKGRLRAGQVTMACSLGPRGIVFSKREGDGATPAGKFALVLALYRSGKWKCLPGTLRSRPIRRQDIWCDASGHGLYNRPARLPFRPSHEQLWREDHVYDVIIVLDYNLRPRVQGRGSAIFFHLAREPATPTAGCVAISAAAMRRLVPRLGAGATMQIRR